LKEIFLNHNRTPSRLAREKATLQAMIEIYCRAHHGSIHHGYCQQLLDYALDRLVHCRFGKHKPTCAKCAVHCFKPYYRQQVREVMRYAGPSMLRYALGVAIRHLWLLVKPESPRVKQIRAQKIEIETQHKDAQGGSFSHSAII